MDAQTAADRTDLEHGAVVLDYTHSLRLHLDTLVHLTPGDRERVE